MHCMICGRFTPVDHGPYQGEDAICCADCWDELDPAQRPVPRPGRRGDGGSASVFWIGLGLGAGLALAIVWLVGLWRGGAM